MAKVTGPLLSLGARGQVAKTQVYATWKGVPYVRQHVIPANPNSAGQQSTRNVFAEANDLWKRAPALFVAPWNRFADGQPKTGRNSMIGGYVADNRGQADLEFWTASPGAKGGLPPLTIVATPAALQITVDLTVPAAPTGWTLEAAVACIVQDGTPGALPDTVIQADEDLVAPYSIVFTGLEAATTYHCFGWLRWVKPDTTLAYGVSIYTPSTTP
jgi:hypothetical protein